MAQDRLPLRERSFRIVMVLIPLAVAIVAIAFAPVITGDSWSKDWELNIGAIGVSVLVLAAAIVIGALARRRIVGDRIEVAIRRPGESQWHHGRVNVDVGHMTFQPIAIGFRGEPRGPVQFDVKAIEVDRGRHPSLRQIWSINPQLHIVQVDTNHGPRELAALPSRISELRRRLESPEIDPIPS